MTVPVPTFLLMRMAAPPARQVKAMHVKMLEIWRREKNEAAKMLAVSIARPEKICQNMGMAAFDSRRRRSQYTKMPFSVSTCACGRW